MRRVCDLEAAARHRLFSFDGPVQTELPLSTRNCRSHGPGHQSSSHSRRRGPLRGAARRLRASRRLLPRTAAAAAWQWARSAAAWAACSASAVRVLRRSGDQVRDSDDSELRSEARSEQVHRSGKGDAERLLLSHTQLGKPHLGRVIRHHVSSLVTPLGMPLSLPGPIRVKNVGRE